MLKFYDVDVEYANFLRQFDEKIMNISYSNRTF
jgi:hypothetical protein